MNVQKIKKFIERVHKTHGGVAVVAMIFKGWLKELLYGSEDEALCLIDWEFDPQLDWTYEELEESGLTKSKIMYLGYYTDGYYSDDRMPLSEIFEEFIRRKFVTINYWITNKKCSKDEAVECFIRSLYGQVDAKYFAYYSSITGYLWTDDNLKIGGHDLINELYSHRDKYLILEVEIHEKGDIKE